MYKQQSNEHVIHPRELIKPRRHALQRFNNKLAVKITNGVGSMWSAYLFAVLSILSLPAIFVLIDPRIRHFFPHFIIATSVITLIAWISQNFLQLVLLPVIMVGQNVIQGQQDRKAEADHKTLTYLTNLQEEQMVELKNLSEILNNLKNTVK